MHKTTCRKHLVTQCPVTFKYLNTGSVKRTIPHTVLLILTKKPQIKSEKWYFTVEFIFKYNGLCTCSLWMTKQIFSTKTKLKIAHFLGEYTEDSFWVLLCSWKQNKQSLLSTLKVELVTISWPQHFLVEKSGTDGQREKAVPRGCSYRSHSHLLVHTSLSQRVHQWVHLTGKRQQCVEKEQPCHTRAEMILWVWS